MSSKFSIKPLYEEVADQIREKIFNHELAPGSWINEKELTELFTEVDHDEISQIFKVIAIFEGSACKLVAQTATDKDLEELDSLHLKLEKAAADRDIDRFFELNQEFHDKIQEVSGNRWMRKVITDLRQVLKLQRRNSLTKLGRLEQSLQEHRQILSALISRKGDLAQELMVNHLRQGQVAAVK